MADRGRIDDRASLRRPAQFLIILIVAAALAVSAFAVASVVLIG